MITIIDYGLGNLKSVAGAVEKLGYPPVISHQKEDIEKADKLILPGVGAFGDGMSKLQKLNLVDILNQVVIKEQKPILGICLGAQLFAKESCEFGLHQGLGWIEASVKKIPDQTLRVPHVGWNDLVQVKDNLLFAKIPTTALFYYVHSFYIGFDSPEIVVGQCEYGVKFTSVFQKNNIYGTQFHPEKSQFYGLALLQNFLEQA